MGKGKHKILLSIDESLYNGLQELPRYVSVSDIVETLLKFSLEDLKHFPRGLSDEEIKEWRRRDPKRLEVISYLRDQLGLGKYVDAIDNAMQITDRAKAEAETKTKKKKSKV